MTAAMAKPQAVTFDDTVLVERAGRGDELAFSEIYRRHARYIAGVAFRLTGDDAAVDDMVQETFIAAYRGIAKIREPGQLRPWLVTIAVRRARRHIARLSRMRKGRAEIARHAPRFGDARDLDRIDELYEVLDRVPVKYRVPWVLSRVEGMTIPEVAEACGWSVATIKRRIAEAENRLKRKLDEY
jgi:RNA polymerase sigma-70 factor (ECF subfamily)